MNLMSTLSVSGLLIRILIRMDPHYLSCWIRICIQNADPDPGCKKDFSCFEVLDALL
jgi:hypothetical protein